MLKRWVVSMSLLLSLCGLSAQAYFDVDQSVKVSAEVSRQPATITVNWIQDPRAISYDLYRRVYGATGWGDKIANYPAEVTRYVDTDVVPERLYEYKIEKFADGVEGYGYVLSGIELPPVHQAGELLLVTTSEMSNAIGPELEEYRAVLEADGWPNRLLLVDADDPVSQVKAAIVTSFDEAPFTAVFLLGDVPTPHSGDIKPDAHPDHRGAWSADIYYGDLDGVWTDATVTITQSANARNHNLPGDENWDQSFLPSDVEVAVGRADFSELPVFMQDSVELLREYLRKDIDFRTKAFTVTRRAAMRNTNPWLGALGQNGIRNFSPLVAPENISYDTWESVFEDDYLFYYAGGGGGYTRLGGAGSSFVYARRPFRAIFTAWFGSYFGDYDSEDNYMRSALGSGITLSAVWAGAPHWHFHTMGMGFPLAHATRLTQNNDTIYTADFFPRGVHVNLLGDPTLKAYISSPPENLEATPVGSTVELAWNPSAEPVDRYYLYRRPANETTYVVIDSISSEMTRYTDAGPFPTDGSFRYLVRAAQLETTPSGSFYNLSTGTTADVEITTGITERSDIALVVYPNPASGAVTISSPAPIQRVQLLTVAGRLLLERSGNGTTEVRVNLADLHTGMYLALVHLKSGVVVRRRVMVMAG